MIIEQFKSMFLPKIYEGLDWLQSALITLGFYLVACSVVLFLTWQVLRMLAPEITGAITGVSGEMYSRWKEETFSINPDSPVGRACAAYKEKSSVHDGAQIPIESYSLGPKESFQFGGYSYDYNNVDFSNEEEA